MKPILVPALFLLVVAGSVTGCARAQAKAVVEPPRLNVPLPPPRVVETVVVETPVPAPPPEAPPAEVPATRTIPAPPRPTRAESPRPAESPKADVAPVEPVGPRHEEPKPSPLQAVPAQQEGKVEAEVRGMLKKASADLSRVDYRALGSTERTQYEQAKAFVTQAEDALRVKQLVFARALADKAATLATQLLGR
jgi:hypothetical protein